MEQWLEIRKRVLREGVSKRQILRETGMHWTTLEKILQHSSPPEYQPTQAPDKPKIGPYLETCAIHDKTYGPLWESFNVPLYILGSISS